MKVREAYLIVMFRLPFGFMFLTKDQIAEAFALQFMKKYKNILELFD